MEILRYSRNAWGQTTLEGVSFELFWVFLGAAVAFVAIHAVVTGLKSRKAKN